MATTTNYGWTTPDNTALVKDGASAIRSLGTAIDTTVFNNAGAAIAKTLIDAKGDLIVGSAADTAAILGVGTNNHVLTADSAATNGVKWAAIPVSASALTLISSTTYSASSAHSVNDVFSSTYDNYLILINTDSASTGSDMSMRLRVSGSDNSSSNYYWANIGNNASSSAYDGSNSGGAATSWRINYNDDTNGSTQTINIRNPYLSLVTSYNNHYLAIEDNNAYPSTGGGRTTVTTSYTGFTIFPNSGTFSGKVRVYGYANS
jgi:hypothetical protein